MSRRRPALLLFAFLLLAPLAVSAQPASSPQLARSIEAVLDDEAFENAWWAVQVVNLKTGEVLYSRNEKKNFIPASNTKLYTTAAALDQLGANYRYRTEVFIDGPVVDGELRGNLIVRGSGDPAIGGRFTDGDRTMTFRAWADSLKARGIRHITGDLIGDDDVFDDTPLGYGWSWDDEPYWYAAEIGGLSYNDNNVDFALDGKVAGQPAEVRWEPYNTDYVEVVNATRTIARSERINEGYARRRSTNIIELSSLVPEGQTDYESLTVTNPTLFFTHVLRETLLREGLSVAGRPVDVDDLPIKPDYEKGGLQLVATYLSPPLPEIVGVINKRSQNLYAEQVLRTLAAEFPADEPDPEASTAEQAIEIAKKTFAEARIDTSRLQLVDGSGLSRQNLVFAEATVRLLQFMWNHPEAAVRAAFYESLPIGGLDGTLGYRYPDGPARGNVRAKTGTVSNASTLSGYVTTAGGTPLAFSLMANHFTVPTREVRQAQDKIVTLLATYRR